MMIDSIELRKSLTELKQNCLMLQPKHDRTRLAVDTKIETIEQFLLVLIKLEKEQITMNDLSKALSVEIVKLSEIPARTRHSDLEEKINEWVKVLEDQTILAKKTKGEPPAIKVNGITYNHLSTKLSTLRKAGKINQAIRLVKAKNDIYLVKR